MTSIYALETQATSYDLRMELLAKFIDWIEEKQEKGWPVSQDIAGFYSIVLLLPPKIWLCDRILLLSIWLGMTYRLWQATTYKHITKAHLNTSPKLSNPKFSPGWWKICTEFIPMGLLIITCTSWAVPIKFFLVRYPRSSYFTILGMNLETILLVLVVT